MPLPLYYREQDTSDLVLQRFLSLFGDQYTVLQALLDKFPDNLDVNETEVFFTDYMAAENAINTTHRDDNSFRYDIKTAVPFYQEKGTASALCEFIRRETGWACSVSEGQEELCLTNIADDLTNDLECTTYDPSLSINANTVLVQLFGTAGDPHLSLKLNRLEEKVFSYVPANANVIFQVKS